MVRKCHQDTKVHQANRPLLAESMKWHLHTVASKYLRQATRSGSTATKKMEKVGDHQFDLTDSSEHSSQPDDKNQWNCLIQRKSRGLAVVEYARSVLTLRDEVTAKHWGSRSTGFHIKRI
jgi:hypothetical protein